MSFDFHPTICTLFGENKIVELGALAKELGGRRILLVSDAGLVCAGHVARALASLQKEALEVFLFTEVEENPTTRHVENGVRFAQAHQPIDLIIALGGGSAMDCAKAINFLLTNGGKMEDYWGMGKASQPMLPSIGVPTTAGTGSEAQSYALIMHEHTHRKMACGDLKARFRAVILDPTLLTSVPNKVAAITGIDAIAHAIESYVCMRRNTISQMFSREAWRLLEKNFEVILREPENLEAQGAMLLGAHFAGHAIENAMLGAAHACANPLTAKYGLAHGAAVGLMLPHVMRYNYAVAAYGYAELANTESEGDANALLERVIALLNCAKIPRRLADCGVERSALPELAQAATLEWTGKFNPRALDTTAFLQLYEAAF
ncbi:iron-containing alcohol dehydrogenase [candidate division KSB1 bacterium]|nr:iron-containing alcohol dehydrogenase [candidate division KSB1 bacterium]